MPWPWSGRREAHVGAADHHGERGGEGGRNVPASAGRHGPPGHDDVVDDPQVGSGVERAGHGRGEQGQGQDPSRDDGPGDGQPHECAARPGQAPPARPPPPPVTRGLDQGATVDSEGHSQRRREGHEEEIGHVRHGQAEQQGDPRREQDGADRVEHGGAPGRRRHRGRVAPVPRPAALHDPCHVGAPKDDHGHQLQAEGQPRIVVNGDPPKVVEQVEWGRCRQLRSQ